MTLARYFVFQQDDTWIVGFEGRIMAHFVTKTAALDSARGMANLMGAMHYDADVMVEDSGLHQVWVYGRDKLISPARRDPQDAAASAAAARPQPHRSAGRGLKGRRHEPREKLHQLRLPARAGLGEHALQLRADRQDALSPSRWRSPRQFRRR